MSSRFSTLRKEEFDQIDIVHSYYTGGRVDYPIKIMIWLYSVLKEYFENAKRIASFQYRVNDTIFVDSLFLGYLIEAYASEYFGLL